MPPGASSTAPISGTPARAATVAPDARRRQQHRTAYVGCSGLFRWLSALLEGSRVARSVHLREKLKSRSRSSGSVTSLARRAHSRAYSRHFVSVLMLGCSEGDGWPTAAKGCSSWVPARAAQGRPHTRDWEPPNHDGGTGEAVRASTGLTGCVGLTTKRVRNGNQALARRQCTRSSRNFSASIETG